jgi:hypothetical protein
MAREVVVSVSREVGEMRDSGRTRLPLYLPGWDQRSTWGWDDGQMTLFAQLWVNGDDSDEPGYWLTPGQDWTHIGHVEILAARIAGITAISERTVLLAMAEELPAPERLRALAGSRSLAR